MTHPVSEFIRKKAGGGYPVPLKATSYEIAVRSGLAVVRQVRTFRNDEKRPIEATVTFPVPFDAAVFGIEAKVGDRVLKGSAKAREEARTAYEKAIDDGKPAVLHEELLRGLHMLSVANVAPGVEIEVTATFAVPVSLAGGDGSFRIPVTVGQIYGRSPLLESDDLLVGGPVCKAQVTVKAGCGTAFVNGGALDGGKATVTLDRPVEVRVAGLYKDSPAALEGRAADGRSVSMSFSPAAGGKAPLDAVVLLDVSGSMSERVQSNPEGNATKWDSVKSGIGAASGSCLKREDMVEVWTFSNACIRHGSATGDRAGAYVGSLSFSSGGTELPAAVAAVTQARREANVLLVTDGKSWNRIDVQAAIATGARFTVVLVGEDALEARVGYLAAMTGGQMFVAAGADVHQAMSAAFASMRGVGSPVVPVKGKPEALSRGVAGTGIDVRWSKAGKKAAARDSEAHAVAAYAAHLAIQGMEENEAAKLAEAEGLVTHLTSIVLVDEAAEAVEGVPATRKVALASPATANASFASVLAAAPAGAPMLRSMAVMDMVVGGHRADAMLYASGMGANRGPAGWASDLQEHGSGILGDWGDIVPADDLRLPKLGLPDLVISDPASLGATVFAVRDVRAMAGFVDWNDVSAAVAKGDLQGLPAWIVAGLTAISALDEVAELARALGLDAKAVAVGLLAEADGDLSRTAGRIARSILGKADKGLADKARRAAGL